MRPGMAFANPWGLEPTRQIRRTDCGSENGNDVATNALRERKGERTALLFTKVRGTASTKQELSMAA